MSLLINIDLVTYLPWWLGNTQVIIFKDLIDPVSKQNQVNKRVARMKSVWFWYGKIQAPTEKIKEQLSRTSSQNLNNGKQAQEAWAGHRT